MRTYGSFIMAFAFISISTVVLGTFDAGMGADLRLGRTAEYIPQANDSVLFFAKVGNATLLLCRNSMIQEFEFTTPIPPIIVPDEHYFNTGTEDRTAELAVLKARRSIMGRTSIRTYFVGANPDAAVFGDDCLSSEVQAGAGFRISGDQYLRKYTTVVYKNIYPGIDLRYHASRSGFKYEFIISPGADPSIIKEQYSTASHMLVAPSGDLRIFCEGGIITEEHPVVFQQYENIRVPIQAAFAITSRNSFGFWIGEYDHTTPLVIDPRLSYSTYFGGNGNEDGYQICLDSTGNIYIYGKTNSDSTANWPRPARSGTGDYDVFVAKFNPTADSLAFLTFFGGSGDESCAQHGMTIGNDGHIYITGFTTSTDMPASEDSSIQAHHHGGLYDAFIAILDQNGVPEYSTYLGGDAEDQAYGIAVDTANNIIIVGWTKSQPGSFPIAGTLFGVWAGDKDAFAAKFDPESGTLSFLTYFGGSDEDQAWAVALDSNNAVLVSGRTTSADIELFTSLQSVRLYGGDRDGFLLRLTPDGSIERWTYFGGPGEDICDAMTMDRDGYLYVTGSTSNSDFIATTDAYHSAARLYADIFVLKQSPGLDNTIYCAIIGGISAAECGNAIAVGRAGDVLITGDTKSGTYDTVLSLQSGIGGGADLFTAHLDSAGSRLLFNTYFGGLSSDYGQSLAIDRDGDIWIAGGSKSTNMQLEGNPYQDSLGGSSDAFIAKIIHPVRIHLRGDSSHVSNIDSMLYVKCGDSVRCTALSEYRDGLPTVDTNKVVWISSDTSKCVVDARGMVYGLKPGRAAVTAQDGLIFDTLWTVVRPNIDVDTAVQAQLADDFFLTVRVPDGADFLQLYYRMGGEWAFRKKRNVMASNGDTLFTDTIPAEYVRPRGIEYYVKGFVDADSTTDPEANPQLNPHQLRVVIGQDYAIALTRDVYQMISFPFEVYPKDIQSIIEDDLGPYDPWVWRCNRYHSLSVDSGYYPEYLHIDPPMPGFAYWMYSRVQTRIDAGGLSTVPNYEKPNDTFKYYAFKLEEGFNQISSPFAFNILWNSREKNTTIDPVIWDYRLGTEKGYVPCDTMRPNHGYWLFASQDTVLALPYIDAKYLMLPRISPTVISDNDWQVWMELSSSDAADKFNVVGVTPWASDYADQSDFREPPTIGRYVTLAILDSACSNSGSLYAGDFRTPSPNGESFDILVKGNTGQAGYLCLGGQTAVPEGYEILLRDPASGRVYDLKRLGSVLIPEVITETGRLYKLYVGPPSAGQGFDEPYSLVPDVYQLLQNRPNPFNGATIIEYALPKPNHVRLEVFNIVGQSVAVLVDAMEVAGYHCVAWNGDDRWRTAAPSGVYFYRLATDGFQRVRKMVLVK